MAIRKVRNPLWLGVVFAAWATTTAGQQPDPAPLDRSFEGLLIEAELDRYRSGENILPELRAVLDDQQRHHRSGAVRVLAELGTPAAVDELVRVVDRRNDLALGFLAINALASMATPESKAALKRISETHWFAPARDRAAAFNTPEGQAEIRRRSILPRSLTATPHDRTRACLAFPVFEEAPVVQGPELPDGFTVASESTFRTPGMLRSVWVDDGWLVAESAGEWGGMLAFVDRGLSITPLANENLSFLAPFGSGWIAVESGTHEQPDVLLISRRADRTFGARVVARAPGSLGTVTGSESGDIAYREGPRMGRDGRLYLTSRRWGGFVIDREEHVVEWPCLAYGADPFAGFSY